MAELIKYEFGSHQSKAKDFEYYCQLMMADPAKLDQLAGLDNESAVNNANAIYYSQAQKWYIDARDNLDADALAEAMEQGRLAFTQAWKVVPQDVSRLYPPA